MKRKVVRVLSAMTMCVMAATWVQTANSQELLINGGFEAGFFGWFTADQPGGSGSWFLSTPGFGTPLNGFPTAPNGGGGLLYAVTDQGGPGAHVLLQPFTVPLNAAVVTLSYEMFVNDFDSGPVVDPAGLDFTFGPNQHSRVDILTAGAAPFSTAPADVVGNFYLGIDSTATNPYTPYAIDITAFVVPGATYQLRFGEVDNQLFLNHGVDNVSVFARVPEPSTAFLLLSSIALLGCSRKKK